MNQSTNTSETETESNNDVNVVDDMNEMNEYDTDYESSILPVNLRIVNNISRGLQQRQSDNNINAHLPPQNNTLSTNPQSQYISTNVEPSNALYSSSAGGYSMLVGNDITEPIRHVNPINIPEHAGYVNKLWNEYYPKNPENEEKNVFLQIISELRSHIDLLDNDQLLLPQEIENELDPENIESEHEDIHESLLKYTDMLKEKIPEKFQDMVACEISYKEHLRIITKITDLATDLDKYSQELNLPYYANNFKEHLQDFLNEILYDTGLKQSKLSYINSVREFNSLIKSSQVLQNSQKIPMCIMCLERVPDQVFTRCGHVACTQCILRIISTNKCHVCRGEIQERVKLHLWS